MKSVKDMVLSLLSAVIEDIGQWDRELYTNLQPDLDRIGRIVNSRGLEIILLDFPAAGKALDKGLSSGVLPYEEIPNSMGSFKKGSCIFYPLFRRCFDANGLRYLSSDPDPEDVLFLRQLLLMFKKTNIDCKPQSYVEAVKDFVKIDSMLREPSLPWVGEHSEFVGSLSSLRARLSFRYSLGGLPPRLANSDESDLWEWGSMRDLSDDSHHTLKVLTHYLDVVSGSILSKMPQFDYRELMPKHGPGAVADKRSGSDKYQFSHWSKRLDSVFPEDYFLTHCEDYSYGCREFASDGKRYLSPLNPDEVTARLLAVPKTYKGPRLITCEPTAHQFLQQGLLKWLRNYLPQTLRNCIDFRDQNPSRAMTLEASRTGSHATVDLSAASDRLSLWTIERMFRHSDILPALYACRSQFVTNGTAYGDSFLIRLNKFSGQGSAVTFPIQSICYAICCMVATLYADGLSPTYKNVRRVSKQIRVFGDDLILPNNAVPYLALILQYLQLKVNASKTHYEGKFRESCGMDAYLGIQVNPVYIRSLTLGNKPSAAQLSSWIDVSNNAHRDGFWHLADALVSAIPEKVKRLIPTSSDTMACLSLFTFSSGRSKSRCNRYNDVLHRDEVLGLVPVSGDDRKQREGSANYLQFFLESPLERVNTTRELMDPRTHKLGFSARLASNLRRKWVQA